MSYFAHGIQSVTIDGASVPIADLVSTYKASEDKIEKLKRHLTTRSRERDLAEERALIFERERDEAVANEAKAREAFNIVTESTSATIETLRRERDVSIEANVLMTRQVLHERALHADTTRDRDRFRDALRDERAAAGTAVDVKRLWLVRRTDAAGKPGEYGKVIVWAADGTDAVDVVMWAGYEGNPMYGYRDRAHTTVVALEYGDEADDQVVVAETLR